MASCGSFGYVQCVEPHRRYNGNATSNLVQSKIYQDEVKQIHEGRCRVVRARSSASLATQLARYVEYSM